MVCWYARLRRGPPSSPGAAGSPSASPEGSAPAGDFGTGMPVIIIVPLNFFGAAGFAFSSSLPHEAHFSAWSVLGLPQLGQ